MKRILITLLVFAAAIFFFCCVTGIAAEIHAHGFYWPKIREMLQNPDNEMWAVLPLAFMIGIIGYWIWDSKP